ncbi:hypothetical protein NEMBOFW57_004159 [Staphylotrichum longicolle]|uniref:C2H2-type domain-containing protein n=1 Tax=Staphylotrichum longicolle TaxID=669026 RepID=A0AAD4F6X1_9PEZI|nr:hypothetical protein NEMBOFW57_004159 [Staphylotrichum longicolle]
MEETLKPVRNKNSNRASGIFQDLRQQAESMVHTPPRANTIPMAITNPGLRTPEFMNMRNISAEFRKIEREFGSIPTSPVNIPDMFSLMKVPNAFENKPDLPPFEEQNMAPVGASSPVSQTPSRRASPHRRTESIASITSAASIADINIEETKTDTGVTLDDIAAFIQGPDPSDGKWRCLYEGCNKPFGRKENIKSHVQTHLNDRQYQCPTCKKCFVRQHDLKRHAKIHTGIKPYPCECGNSFARHDALTRHRQRGMCIGAFDGVVRKVVKRGRPKKIRPDMDERRDKAERTRRKNKVTSANSASSQSGYSDISAANSPSNDFDGLLDDDHFPSFTLPPATIHPTTLAVSTAPIPTTGTTTTSMATIYRSISPSAMSNYSQTSTSNHPHPTLPPLPRQQASTATSTSTADFSDIHNNNSSNSPPSPTKSVASHYTHHAATTPPDLSSPRSPPPLASSGGSGGGASARWVDLDPGNASDLSDVSIGLGTTVAAHAASAAGAGTGAAGNAFNGAGGLEAYQHDSMLLGFHVGEELFEKFDDEFDPVSMFTNGEDVFFGTA